MEANDAGENFEITLKELQKKKTVAAKGQKKDEKSYIVACNDLAMFYYSNHYFDDALREFQAAANICENRFPMEWARCNRMIGETYLLKGDYESALAYVENFLLTARELKDLVEEERAMGTKGRIYLLQGQSLALDKDEQSKKKAFMLTAEECFNATLDLCDKIEEKKKVKKSELADMRARVKINIGVVKEFLQTFDDALCYINEAITLCESHRLYETMYKCYMSKGLLFFNKKKDNFQALLWFEKALKIVDHLKDKILNTCEILAVKAEVLCCMSEYKQAKKALHKAWKLKTPAELERKEIESNLKVVAGICYTEDFIKTYDESDNNGLKKMYEKLGDYTSYLKNYDDSLKYYLKMLEHAELSGESGVILTPIYISLYQTYKDLGRYNDALSYIEKEYALIQNIPIEAFATLYHKAEYLFLAKKPYEEIEQACLDGVEAARKIKDDLSEIKIRKRLLKYQRLNKMSVTENLLALEKLKCTDVNLDDEEQTQQAFDANIIENSIRLDLLTDDESETEDQNENQSVENSDGQTQLHTACKSGNKLLVERLLATGHPVNIRDNAGWMPLHEACIHGHVDVAQLLIEHGASVNDRGGANCKGITPLYEAVCQGHLHVVELLLENGADPLLKTADNETPLQAFHLWRKEVELSPKAQELVKTINNLMSEK